jgi:hypothetical protein
VVWNKTLPDGNKNIALGDDDIRLNNDALEAALSLEHDFEGLGPSLQTGRHNFFVGTIADIGDIDEANDGAHDGSIAFANDARTGQYVLYVYKDDDGAGPNLGTWVPVDIADGLFVPRTNEQSIYETAQWADIEACNVASGEVVDGPVAQMSIDLSKAAYRYHDLVKDLNITNFTNVNGANSTTLILEVQQPSAGAGPYNVTFESSNIFETSFGAAPVIGLGSDEKTIIQFTRTRLGTWLVTTQPSVSFI